MTPGDTSLGGPHNRFPETTLGLVSCVRQPDPQGLEEFGRRYWKPIYAYLRTVLAKNNEDAKDLTQAFFLWLVEGEPLRSYDPGRGGFRRYLKLLLRRFVVHRDVALLRLKRGGGVRLLSFDHEADLEALVADPRAADPGKVFDRIWIREVVQGAVERVKERCLAEGRESAFRVYEEYDLSSEPRRPTHAELKEKFRLGENQARFFLFSTREEVREEIRTELARVTTDPQELEAEWNELLGG